MSDSPEGSDTPPWTTGEGQDAAAEQAPVDTAPTAAELEAQGQNALFAEAQTPPTPAQESLPPPAAEPARSDAEPTAAKPEPAQAYRVLARKYRPQTFSELIGQDAMVRTLGNAIARDRLAHAFLMTGVRGVGKTSTARLIAKALNCIGPDGEGGPTIDPCGVCEPCIAIAEGRHIDVIEMDAASNTQVDKMRELLDGVMYAAVTARYKIYIIDEVHMLSNSSFNAMLKTLEEPPAHVKFIFATTEVNKVPITVLSRTQRFDLKRITRDMLQDHFAMIAEAEGVGAEEEALAMIAAAAEGSVRDGLSILDQAISHADMDGDGGTGGTMVRADKVRDMLGLADKGAQRRLFQHILEGDPQALLAAIADQHALGVEPLALLRSQMDLAHRLAITQIGGGAADAPSQEEREVLEGWADRLTPGQLHRLWQLLLKGHDEVRTAPDPLIAAEMALLRILHAADLPDPGKLAKLVQDAALSGAAAPAATAAGSEAGGASQSLSWKDIIAAVGNSGIEGALTLASMLEAQVRVLSLEPGKLVYTQPPGFADDITRTIKKGLQDALGSGWEVLRGTGEGQPSIVEQRAAAEQAKKDRLEAHPMMQAVRRHFPDAKRVEPEAAPRGREDWSRRA